MRTSNFQTSDGFTTLIIELARERLFKNKDFEGAVSVIQRSFINMPREEAVKLLAGERQLFYAENGEICSCNLEDVEDPVFLPKDIQEFVDTELGELRKDVDCWLQCVDRIIQQAADDNGIISCNFHLTSLGRHWLEDEEEPWGDDEDVEHLHICITNLSQFLKDAVSTITNVEAIIKAFPILFKDVSFPVFPESLPELYKKIECLTDRAEFDKAAAEINAQEGRLISFCDQRAEICRNLATLKPMDITNAYDAGWLAPNGDFYGLFGTVSQLMHLNIADALEAQGIIPSAECRIVENGGREMAADTWLYKHGWAKICYRSTVYFDGYFGAEIGEEVHPLTPAQIDKLCLLADKVGNLLCGPRSVPVSAYRLRETEPLMLKNLFTYD